MMKSLIFMYSKNSFANFDEKMSTKSAYSLKTLVEASSTFKWVIFALCKRCISSLKSTLKTAMCTTKASCFRSRAITTNFYFFISSTCLVVRSTSSIIYNLYYKSWAWKLMSTLFMIRKDILSTMSGLTSINKKLSSKNLFLLFLFDREKIEITIL